MSYQTGKLGHRGRAKMQKTCFLEDLEEMPQKTKETFSPKSRFVNDNEVKNVTQNNATMTEGHITRSTFSASTPNIYSSSSSTAAKRDFRNLHNDEKNIGIPHKLLSPYISYN